MCCKKIIPFLIFSLALFCSNAAAQRRSDKSKPKPAEAEPAQGEPTGPLIVARVLSGDLIELTSGRRVRLMGADAPVMPANNSAGQEPWAGEALKFTESLVLNKEITVKSIGYKTDQYGRLVGIVYVGDTCLDCELIKQGFAMLQLNPNSICRPSRY